MTIKRDLQPKLLVVVPLSINKRKKEAEKKEEKEVNKSLSLISLGSRTLVII